MEDFSYQLTEWAVGMDDCIFAANQLMKYNAAFKWIKNPAGQIAIFTKPPKNFTPDKGENYIKKPQKNE